VRRFIFLGFVICLGMGVRAQTNPVQWMFWAKRTSGKSYEIHLKATVQSPWHIYSQHTPPGGPVPTQINFMKNPLLIIEGRPRENGRLVTKHEEVFGTNVKYFDGVVEFVHVIKLKSPAKTKLNGAIEYMVCNDEQCLPPTSVPFSIVLD
jgi:thiol:disulfide interchange protein DsbD